MSLRIGTNAASVLLDSNSVCDWESALEKYDVALAQVVEDKKRSSLVTLDTWWRSEYPIALQSRKDEHHHHLPLKHLMN